MNWRHGYEKGSGFAGPSKILRSAWDAKLALLTPVLILGGIYSGLFTPTESAAVAVGVIVIATMAQGELSLHQFPDMLERSAVINGVVAPLLAVALLFGNMMSLYNVPSALVDFMLSLTSSPAGIILIMFAILVLAGAVMETGPNLVILGPLLLPTAVEIGMDPVHYTVFLVTALGVGFITPPFGLNLFVMAGITGESVDRVARRAVPFVVVLLAITLLIAFVPQLFMWTV